MRDLEYVTGYLFNDDLTEVALIRKTHPYDQAGLYNGIGGKLERFEDPQRGLLREFEEETGVTTMDMVTKALRLWEPTVYLQGIDWKVYHFRAASSQLIEELRGKTEWPTDEHVHIWPVDALPDNLYTHVAWIIHMSVAPGLRFPLRVDDKAPPADHICPRCFECYAFETHSKCPHCGYEEANNA